MKKPARILIVEHSATDADLAQRIIQEALKKSKFQVVENRREFLAALNSFQPDIILADDHLPRFDGMKVLKLALAHAPLTPVIIWTDSLSEELGIACTKAGASNYLLKKDIKRLGSIVLRALAERQVLLERRQAEERYRAIFENSVEGIFQSTPEGRYLNVNAAMARIYGYDSPGDMIRSVRNIVEQIYVDPGRRAQFLSLLHSRKTIENFEEQNYRKDGSIIWTSTSARTVCDPDGNVQYYEGIIADITERKYFEQKLQERERQLGMLFSSLPGSVYRCRNDADYTMDFVSEGITELSGYPPEEFQEHRQHLGRMIHPEDRQRVWAEIQAAVKRDRLFELTYRIVTAAGEVKWVSDRGQAIRDADGQLQALEGFITDITQRIQAEEASHESQTKYKSLVETSHDLIWSVDLQGRFTFINQAVREIFGYEPEKLLGRSFFDIFTLRSSQQDWEIFREAMAENEEFKNVETYVRHRDGKQLIFSTNAIVMRDGGGSLIGLTGSSHEITLHKQMEEELQQERNLLRTLIDHLPDRIYAMDRQGRKMLSNTADWRASGATLDEILGKTDFDIYPPELGAEYWRLDQNVLESGIPLINHEEPGLDGMGNWVSILTSKIPLRDEGGNVTGLVGIGRDITPRKAAEIERQVLLEIMQGFAHTSDLLALLELIHHSIARVICAENFLVMLHQPASGRFEEIYCVDQYDEPGPPSTLEKSITAYVFRSGEPLLLSQARFDELIGRGEVALVGTNSASWLGVPLRAAGRIIGVMAVQDYEQPNRYSERDKEFLSSIAAQIALAIERKRADEELKKAEAKYRTLVERLPVVIYTAELGVNGAWHYVSPQIEDLLGFTPEEWTADPGLWCRQMHPEDRKHQQELEEQGYRQNELLVEEYRIFARDGRQLWIRDSAQVLPPVGDGPPIAQGILMDLTERKQVEQELRASEERFIQLANNIQEVFWMTDAVTGKEIYMSPAAAPIWGRSVESLMQERGAFINSVFLEDRPRVLQAIEREKSGEKVEIEYRIVRPDGSLRWIWDRAFPIWDGSGRVIRLAGISADITERRESELALLKSQSRYRELFDSSPISIWEEDFSGVKQQIDMLFQSGVTDLGGYLSSHPEKLAELASLVQVADVNKAALELYQLEDKNALLKALAQILSPDALEHFREELLGLLGSQRKFLWEGFDRTLSGEPIAVMVAGSIPQGYEEDWSKVIVSITDITERKHAEEEVQRRVEETSALLETSQALTSLDLQVTLETIGHSAKNLFDADGCRIFLMEPNGEFLRCVLTLQENFAAFSDLRLRVGEGVTGTVAATGRAEIVNEMENDPRAVQVSGTPEKEDEGIMFAPLKERDRTLGVLSIRRVGHARRFQPADLELLEAFAAMAASAVSNARLFEETQRRLAELEALYENGLAVGRLLNAEQIGNRVIQTFARYLRWHHVAIRLIQEATDELELVAFNLPDLKEEDRAAVEKQFNTLISKLGQGISGWAIQVGQPVRTGNVHIHPHYVSTQPGIQSGLYMPLKVGDRIIGVISVESELPDAFTEQDERLLATLASQAAIAFENARLYEAVQKELSERKRAEDALRISEAHYRELADSITDILFELDQDLRYTYWNKASEMFSGIPAREAIGRSILEVFGASEEQLRRVEIYRRVLREQQARTFEVEILVKGQKRALEINAYPSRRGVSVVAKDITDRKRSETIVQKRFELMEYSAHHKLSELMQRIVDEVSELTSSTIGFFHFVDEDEKQLGFQTWSTNALRLFNVPISEGTHLPLDRAGVWAEAVRQRRALIQNDYESLSQKMGLPRGHVPIVREIVIPIIRNERIMAVLGIGNKPEDYTSYDLEIASRLADYAWDITERKQMEVALAEERNQLARRVEERTADLSRANSNLARALRVKDEFLANMSHELRTPLNAILGLSESLGEQIAGPLNEKQHKYITTISESGHHLLALINDILDLAKIEAGQITLDINKVDIHSVCQASLRMVKQLAQKKNQDVSLIIEDGLGLMWADERRLKQMIVNLLGNAVKFTPEHEKIGLEVHGDADANKITITVWDTGIGIKGDDLRRLFQPFVQLDSGLAREATGTGLGLALVAQMARLHGGTVSASSEPGVGSRFSIVLPWEPALALDSATRMRVTGKFRAIKMDETNRPTILLVEDTKEVIMMIKDYLELAGYKIVTAQDGADAIVQANLVHPDLILMDVQMPRMDGFEATRRLRSDPAFKFTPIIALTALAMPDDRERCLAAGMDEYISKPVNLKALVKIIQSCLFSEESEAR
jgi:PAS domain S-box-containing protein